MYNAYNTPRPVKMNHKTDVPFSITVNKKPYSGHLHFPKGAQHPTRMEVIINQKKIGGLQRGHTGTWRFYLNDEGIEMFPELNTLKDYELKSMAADLGDIVQCNWNSPFWAVRVKKPEPESQPAPKKFLGVS